MIFKTMERSYVSVHLAAYSASDGRDGSSLLIGLGSNGAAEGVVGVCVWSVSRRSCRGARGAWARMSIERVSIKCVVQRLASHRGRKSRGKKLGLHGLSKALSPLEQLREEGKPSLRCRHVVEGWRLAGTYNILASTLVHDVCSW